MSMYDFVNENMDKGKTRWRRKREMHKFRKNHETVTEYHLGGWVSNYPERTLNETTFLF